MDYQEKGILKPSMKLNPIGILQGRLIPSPSGKLQVFPVDRWEEEFSLASTLGFQGIEWLLEAETGDQNPLWQKESWPRIEDLMKNQGMEIPSVCADYVQSSHLSSQSGITPQRWAGRLASAVEAAGNLGARCVLVPAMEQALQPRSKAQEALIRGLAPALDRALQWGVKVGLEMEWPAEEQAGLVEQIGHPAAGVYYDLGNATSRGFQLGRDIRLLGGTLVGVHVKDRKIHGPSVPLGQGDTDFTAAFQALQEIEYEGPFILETPRGTDPLSAARENLAFVRQALNATGIQ